MTLCNSPTAPTTVSVCESHCAVMPHAWTVQCLPHIGGEACTLAMPIFTNRGSTPSSWRPNVVCRCFPI